MLVSGVLFVGVTGIVRYLGNEMNPIQAAFIRYGFGIALVIPVILRLGLPSLQPQNSTIAENTTVFLWFSLGFKFRSNRSY